MMAPLSVAEALAPDFRRTWRRRRPSSIAVEAAHGRILADGLVARLTQPPFDASAMDGYAVRSADLARSAHHA